MGNGFDCIRLTFVSMVLIYDTEKVFVMRFLTHAEYSKDHWKDSL